MSSSSQASIWSCLVAGCINDDRLSTALQLQLATNRHRQNNNRYHETEELFMSDFNRLSIEEQATVMEDIYSAAGSALLEDENPLMIDRLLREFEQEIERGQYAIYDLALDQDRSYVEDPAFRLYFLRANLHDVKQAVKQMIAFLHQKVKHFGAEKVAQDITLDDLTPADLTLMLSGIYHIQDDTDRSGRVILYVLQTHPAEDLNSQIRIIFYIWSSILIPKHSVQMKGVVMVAYGVKKSSDQQTNHGLGGTKRFVDVLLCMPIRTSAFHFCVESEGNNFVPVNAFAQLAFTMLPKSMRERTRFHRGSAIELQYHLSSYGIPQLTFPIDLNGKLREGIKNAWFYKRLEETGEVTRHLIGQHDNDDSMSLDEESIESLSSSAGEAAEGGDDDLVPANPPDDELEIVAPRPPYSNQDVLLGRGHDVQNHPGNTAFRQFLSDYQEEYDDAPRLSKRTITRRLTRALLANGVRFWQKTDVDVWVEANFDDAEKKVGQLFRSVRKVRNNR